MEQGLFVQVVIIGQKYFDNKEEKEKTKKYNFRGKSTRSMRWFDIYHEWLEKKSRTHEPGLYKEKSPKNIKGRETKTYQFVVVPIGNAKNKMKIVFHPESPVLKYCQKLSYSFCLSSLSSAFHIIVDYRDEPSLDDIIEQSLPIHIDKSNNRIDFANI